jgi:cytochrome c1
MRRSLAVAGRPWRGRVAALALIVAGAAACAPWARARQAQPVRQMDRVASAAGDASAAGATVAPGAALPTPVHLTPAPSVAGSPENGRRLFTTAGCAGCHTMAGVPGGNGVAGPNLTNVVLRPTLAGETIPLSPDTLVRWLLNPQSVKPGATMPSVGLTPPEAQDLAAFLYSLPYNPAP